MTDPVQSRGEFGDQFGLTNAVFSGLALLFVALTLYLQTVELRLQRKEIDESQEILKEQAAILAAQTQSNLVQVFENKFFNILNNFKDIQRVFRREDLPQWTAHCLALVKYHNSEYNENDYPLGHPYGLTAKDTELLRKMISQANLLMMRRGLDIDNLRPHPIAKMLDDRIVCACAYAMIAPHIHSRAAHYFGNFLSMLREIDRFVSSHDFLDPRDGTRYAQIACNLLTSGERRFLALYADYMNDTELFESCIKYEVFELADSENGLDWIGIGPHAWSLPFVWYKGHNDAPPVLVERVDDNFFVNVHKMIEANKSPSAESPFKGVVPLVDARTPLTPTTTTNSSSRT